MKNIKYVFLTSSILLFSAFTISSSINWTISKEHQIKFSGTDAVGIFKTLSGEVNFDKNHLETSQFSFTIDVNSINTGNGIKNKHAVSDKWFDAEKFPNINFKSTGFSKADNEYKVTGIMEIRGVKKEITVPFTFSDNVFKTKFAVNRLDFNIGTMEGMMAKVSNEIKLDISIPVVKK
jgi:polyisoprenoid-binding protein YceI